MNLKNLKIESVDRTPKGGQRCGASIVDIKVTHIPSGLTASCGLERSQTKNRDVAIAMPEYGMTELGISDP